MKKVIRLNENDIERLVKKIIKEEDEQLSLGFPEEENDDDDDDVELHQEGYNIGYMAASELLELLGRNDDDDLIINSFVKGFIENSDDEIVNTIHDAIMNRPEEETEEEETEEEESEEEDEENYMSESRFRFDDIISQNKNTKRKK